MFAGGVLLGFGLAAAIITPLQCSVQKDGGRISEHFNLNVYTDFPGDNKKIANGTNLHINIRNKDNTEVRDTVKWDFKS
jgi:hypothetical protein